MVVSGSGGGGYTSGLLILRCSKKVLASLYNNKPGILAIAFKISTFCDDDDDDDDGRCGDGSNDDDTSRLTIPVLNGFNSRVIGGAQLSLDLLTNPFH